MGGSEWQHLLVSCVLTYSGEPTCTKRPVHQDRVRIYKHYNCYTYQRLPPDLAYHHIYCVSVIKAGEYSSWAGVLFPWLLGSRLRRQTARFCWAETGECQLSCLYMLNTSFIFKSSQMYWSIFLAYLFIAHPIQATARLVSVSQSHYHVTLRLYLYCLSYNPMFYAYICLAEIHLYWSLLVGDQ